jgi:hypothetical protein
MKTLSPFTYSSRTITRPRHSKCGLKLRKDGFELFPERNRGFADSPLEEAGFEPLVPHLEAGTRELEIDVCSRGPEVRNPAFSSAESGCEPSRRLDEFVRSNKPAMLYFSRSD